MSQIEDLRKFSGNEIIFTILFVSSTLCPGILTLWFFVPTFAKDFSAFLIILLSISITLPIISINIISFITFLESGLNIDVYPPSSQENETKINVRANLIIMSASIVSLVIICIPLLLSFIMSYPLKTFFWLVVGFEAMFLLLGKLRTWQHVKTNRRN
jgi:hypothetical protein